MQRADTQFANFIEEYEKLGLMEKTIFVLTSDHGEELYEHGRIDHGHSLYDELIKIPLIITVPDMNMKSELAQQVRSVDLIPTIFNLVTADVSENVNAQMEGENLLPIMQGWEKLLEAYPETNYRYATFQRAIRTTDNWKLILNLETNIKELYNLNKDQKEKNNLFVEKPEQTKLLKLKLQRYLKEDIN